MLIESTRPIKFNVELDLSDWQYHIRAYNETGGREFTTWWGQSSKQRAMNQFWGSFDVQIYDHETKRVYEKGELVDVIVQSQSGNQESKDD